jgi:FAD/FMN-containing dehydrogenase
MSSSSTLDLYQSALQPERTRPKRKKPARVHSAQPKSAEDIATIMLNPSTYPSPLRPLGSGSSVTRCASTATGTILDMSLLDRVLAETEDTITVQAGMRLRDLAEYLAHEGKELVCGCVDPNRTVGGAISSGTLGGGMPGDASQLASSVCQITLINGLGRRVEVTEKLPDLLVLTRMSYGLLGVVYSVMLRTRPIQSYVTRNSKFDFGEFSKIIPTLMEAKGAVRASLMPFRDRVYVELRYPDDSGRTTANLPSRLRQWASDKALPSVVRSVSKVVPVKNLRDPLIDGFTEATHVLFASTTVSSSNAADQTGAFKIMKVDKATHQCVWFFSAAIFPEVLKAYKQFCVTHYKKTGFRCDLPAEVWRIDHDQSSLLSPSFDSAVFSIHLRATTEAKDGWNDYLYEFAEFAARYKGIPVFNQTSAFKPGYAYKIYGQRLRRFKDIRSRLDPKNRLLNQFFAEHLR